MSPKNGSQSVVSDPQWIPSHWDRSGTLQFVRIPRERHGDLTFLADEYLGPAQLPTTTVSIAELLPPAPPRSSAPHFVFHSAFCCSTLIARALDIPGTALALKEPQILNELADAARAGALNGEMFGLVMSLLGRAPAPGESIIIKPSNVVNVLAPALMNNPQSRAVFLYAPLRRFLASVAAKGLWGRRWSRRLYMQLLGDTGLKFGFAEAEQFELSDVQAAALAWLMHHAQGTALLHQYPGRVRTLDSEVFLAKRVEALAALAGHFELDLDREQARTIADGPVFATHSKELGRKFDPEDSLAQRPSAAIIDEEIEMVSTWLAHVADHVGIATQFSEESALLADG